MTTSLASIGLQASLRDAASALMALPSTGLTSAQRKTIEEAAAAIDGAVEYVRVVPPAPPLHSTQRRGPVPPADLEAWLDAQGVGGSLITYDEASQRLGCEWAVVRDLAYGGDLPRYDLGWTHPRTRLGGARVGSLYGDPITAEQAADHLGVDKKWIYNHLGELPHCVLGSGKSFRYDELDWYLECFRRKRSSRGRGV